jgi:hypothetical protein
VQKGLGRRQVGARQLRQGNGRRQRRARIVQCR